MKAFRRRGLVFGFIFITGTLAADVRAASWYWDANGGTTAGAGDTPNGTWGTSSFWNSNSTGGSGTFTTTCGSSDTLCFVASAGTSSGENPYTVTVSGNQNASGLNFQSSGAPTLSGTGTINLWGSGITVPQYAFGTTAQGAVTISAAIDLQAAQNWSNSSNNLLSINGSVNNNGYSLSIGGAGITLLPGNISGSGGLNKTDGGTLVLQSANTFTGATTISGGTLDVSYAGALQSSTLGAPTGGSVVFDQNVASRAFNLGALSGSGNLVLQNNASSPAAITLNVGGNSVTTTYSGNLSGSGTLVVMGSGEFTLSGNNTYGGGTTVTSGSAIFTNPGALPSYSTTAAMLNVANGATLVLDVGVSGWTAASIGSLLAANSGSFAAGSTLDIDTTGASGTTTVNSSIAGNLGLVKLGANSLSLSSANTFSGMTTVSAGTLNVANSNALQNSTLVAPTVGTVVLAPGVGSFNVGGLTGSGNLSLQNGPAIVGWNNSSTVYSGALSGSGALIKYGNGCLCLTGTNTYSGTTVVNYGAVQLGDGSSGHDGVVSANNGILNNAALVYDLYGSETYAGVITGGGTLTKLGGGTLILTASNTFSGGTTIGGGTLQLGNGVSGYDGALAAAGGINDSAMLAFDLYGSQTYRGSITGQGGMTKIGSGLLTLGGSNTFSGATAMSGGTLKLSNANALQVSTLALNSGSIAFDASVSPASFTLGGLSGSGNLALLNNAFVPAPVSLTVGGNNASTAYGGNLSGSGTLTKTGLGTLTLNGSDSCKSALVSAGGVLLAGTGSLTTTGSGNFSVGTSSPASVTIQDSAALNVGGNLLLNPQNTTGNPSTLTQTGGSLAVSGKTYIGEAAVRTGPTTTSAAFYQSAGTTRLSGLVTVGDNGTAMSLLDINGGSLTAAGGLTVGNSGNGAVNIQGSGIVNVTGGLAIGQDAGLATAGSVSLSSGTLAVAGNLTLGNGGIASFTRSGGALSVSGNLAINGASQLVLDATVANVGSTFAGLSHTVGSTLLVVPQTGNLATGESLGFSTAPGLSSGTGGILGAWAVVAASGSDSIGDYLTTTGSGTKYLASAGSIYHSFSGSTSATVVAATASSTLSTNMTAYAVKFSPVTTTLGSSANLTVAGNGMILNGGTLVGGSVIFPGEPLVYAGSTTASCVASGMVGDHGLVKFGPGTLVLAGNNSNLSGGMTIDAGVVRAQSSWALGPGGVGSPVTVAAGAALEIQGNSAQGNVPVNLNGTGIGGNGSLRNVQDNNFLSGTINVASNSQLTTTAGTLTLYGPVQGNSTLTKTGNGTLVLAGASGFSFPVFTVAGGVVAVQNSAGLGNYSPGVTVNSGATLCLQNGSAVGTVPLTISGGGTGGNGALDASQGGGSYAGAITLAGDGQVNVDSAADTLTLSGNIGGGFALTKGGAGTLVLSGNNTFTEALNMLSGSLSVPSVNAAGSAGPLGQGTAPVVLGGGGAAATFIYTGAGATSNRPFTLGAGTGAAGSGGIFQVASSLTLNGTIDGNGGLATSGGGILTLGGSNLYTGATTVSAGTLAIGPTGSINASGDVFVNPGCVLQVTAAATGGSQLPDTGNFTLSAATLNYAANTPVSAGQSVGALALGPGQSQIALIDAGSGTVYLQFASGTPHTAGATIGFFTVGGQVQFLANPPAETGGIIPYAFVGPPGTTTVDFTSLSPSGGATVVSALTYAASTAGNVGAMNSNAALNVAATGTLSTMTSAHEFNSLKLDTTSPLSMTGGAALKLDSGGLIATDGPSAISGGTLTAPAGELVVNTATSLTISSVISASTALTKTGPATLTLTNTSPIAGDLYINQGTLAFAPTANSTYAHGIHGTGTLAISGTSAALGLSGTCNFTGNTNVTTGTLAINGRFAGGGVVSVYSGATLAVNGSLTGACPIILQGGSVLSGSGNIAGSATINSGLLTIGQQGPFGSLTIAGGLNVGGSGSVAAAGPASAVLANLSYTSNSSSAFSGTILGANSSVTLNSPASVTLTLSGSNWYGGGTTIQSGLLLATNTAALGSGGVTMSGGTLNIAGPASIEIPRLSGPGGVVTTTATAGTTTLLVNSGAAFAGTIANHGNGIVTLELPSLDTGTLVLSGSNTYTGGTFVYGGTLEIGNPAGLLSGTNLTVGANAAFAFGAVVPDVSAGPAGNVAAPAGAQVAAVPEPGTLFLLLTAALGLALIRLGRKAG